VNYIAVFGRDDQYEFSATTDRRAEIIAQKHAAEIRATTFRLYRLWVCPTCKHNTDTYLGLWELSPDGWMLVEA